MNVEKYEEWCQYYDPEQKELKLLRSLIDLNNKTILEVGCGTGRLSFRILPYVRKLVGIDKEEGAIRICDQKKQKSIFHDRAEFITIDANFMNFPSSFFDIVIFSWSIYLISDKTSILENVKKILKENGIVVVLQPIAGYFEEILFHFYKNSNLEQFAAHSSESLILLKKLFNNCIEHTLKSYFVFPTIEKTKEMIEFFIQDEDFRPLSDEEKIFLRKKLKNFINNSGQIVLSDIVKIMISKKATNQVGGKMLKEEKDIFKEGLSLLEKKLYNNALEKFKQIESNIRAKLNICIIHDIKRDGINLKKELPDPTQIESADYKIWYSLGLLFHKINDFDNAIYCFDKCLELNKNFIHALIKKGYSLEGTEPHKLDKAIECFKYILNIDSEEVIGELGEIYHGLGHFLTESNKPKEGIEYMKKAMIEDVGYITCFGTCHSEQKKYSQALEIFNDALTLEGLKRIYTDSSLSDYEIQQRHQIVQENKDLRNEIIFYRGEAYCGLGNFAKAIEDFQHFTSYCRKTNNKNGLAHAQLYIAKSFLKQSNILLIEPKDIKEHLEILKNSPFSLYANRYIHEDWKKTVKILEGLLKLKLLLLNAETTTDEIMDVTNYLISIFPNEKFNYIFISDKTKTSPIKHDSLNMYSKWNLNKIENIKDLSFILVELTNELSTEILSILFQYSSFYPIFVLNQNMNIDLSSSIGSRVNDILIFSDIPSLECTVLLIGAYEKIKYDLLETVFLFGLTPTTEAPSFSAQTGVLDVLENSNGEK